jgi:predicted Zn-dependent protease
MQARRGVLAVLVAAALGAALLPPSGALGLSVGPLSDQQEIQLGRQIEAQLAQDPGFVNDPTTAQTVRSIGLRLARVSERPGLPWTYHIVRQSGVNAFAVPGGFVFVTPGLPRFVRSRDELAFVLGHETTHVAHRHAADLARRDMELQFGTLVVTQLLFGGSMAAYQLSQIGRALIDAKYSRDKEFEADHYGVIYARRAGFDPRAAITFFTRLAQIDKTKPGALQHAFEDHPDTPKRIAALRQELRSMGYRNIGFLGPREVAAGAPTGVGR